MRSKQIRVSKNICPKCSSQSFKQTQPWSLFRKNEVKLLKQAMKLHIHQNDVKKDIIGKKPDIVSINMFSKCSCNYFKELYPWISFRKIKVSSSRRRWSCDLTNDVGKRREMLSKILQMFCKNQVYTRLERRWSGKISGIRAKWRNNLRYSFKAKHGIKIIILPGCSPGHKEQRYSL